MHLEFTGERFTPECLREIRYEHLHRYAFARSLVGGLSVLDAACGEGYGSAMMAGPAASVTGVDLSESTIEHARERYRADKLSFEVADCVDLPFGDGEFDCVVSFETLEHLEDQRGLLAEFRRVLKPGGFLVLSTPDKAVYTDKQQNRNEFHVRELYRDEFESLVGEYFPAHRLWGQKLQFMSSIWSLDQRPGVAFLQEDGGEVSESARPVQEPVYLIAVCAADETSLPAFGEGLSLFDDTVESVYGHYNHEIRKNMSAGGLLEEKDREIAALKAALSRAGPAMPWWRRLFGRS